MSTACRSSGEKMKSPTDLIQEGCVFLDPILRPHGFVFEQGGSGATSGGPASSGWYRNGNRRLEFHFRFSLGLVTYHFGALSLSHQDYMFAILGKKGGNQYPCFSDEPMDAFRGLAHDLGEYAGAFLAGNVDKFRCCVDIAAEQAKASAFARLAQHEG